LFAIKAEAVVKIRTKAECQSLKGKKAVQKGKTVLINMNINMT
jgi:hypothetical protein